MAPSSQFQIRILPYGPQDAGPGGFRAYAESPAKQGRRDRDVRRTAHNTNECTERARAHLHFGCRGCMQGCGSAQQRKEGSKKNKRIEGKSKFTGPSTGCPLGRLTSRGPTGNARKETARKGTGVQSALSTHDALHARTHSHESTSRGPPRPPPPPGTSRCGPGSGSWTCRSASAAGASSARTTSTARGHGPTRSGATRASPPRSAAR